MSTPVGWASASECGHMFRHTLGTTLLNKGAPLVAVQSILGHEEPETTQVYARAKWHQSATGISEVLHPMRVVQERDRVKDAPSYNGSENEIKVEPLPC
jgi:hypothetical protein